MGESATRRDFRHTLTLAAGIGAATLLSSVYLIVAARQFGPQAYAEFAAAVALAMFVAYSFGWTTLVLGQLSAQFASRGQLGKLRAMTDGFIAILTGSALVLSPLAVLLLPSLATAMQMHILSLYAAAILTVTVLLVAAVRAALRGAQHFGAYSLSAAAEALLRLCVGVILIAAFATPAAGVSAYAIAAAVIAGVCWVQLRRLGPGTTFDRAEVSQALRLAVPASIVVVALAGFTNVDILLVKRYFPPTDAGIYAAAAAAAKIILIVVMPVDALLLPRLSYLRETNPAEIGPTILRMLMYCGLFGIMVLGFIGAFARPLVRLLYGRQYAGASGLLLLLCSFLLVLYLSYFACQILITIGRFRWIAVFATGFLIEVAAIILLHNTTRTVATILVVNQVVCFVVLAIGVAIALRRLDRANVGPAAPGPPYGTPTGSV